MNLRRALALLLCSAFAALAAAGCRVQQPPSQHERDQILYQSTISDPRTFNPILVTDNASGEVVGDLFEGLVRINPITTLPEPGLAESWELGDGGKVIVFHLRHGVKWFDGQPFTARDVVFTMRVIYDPRVPNIEEPSLTVDGKPLKVEALDDYTVRMTMPRVFAPLLYAIGVPIVPAHLLEAALDAGKFNHTWGINTPPEKIVGLGQFGWPVMFRRSSSISIAISTIGCATKKACGCRACTARRCKSCPTATPSTCAFWPGRSTSTRRVPRKSSISVANGSN